MNVRRISLLCVLAALLVLPATALRAAEEENGVKALDEAWGKAILAGDVDAIVACYADDAVLWTPHEAECKGKDAIRDSFKRMFDDVKVTAIKMEDAHYHAMGERAVGWGTFTITVKPKDGGDEQTVRGRFTEIAEKRGGKWVYVVDHASADEK